MGTENRESCSQRDSAERKGYPVKTRIVYCKDKDRTKEEELTDDRV